MADKQKALETAISQIEKNFGKGSIMRLGQNTAMNVEAISTGSVTLDAVTGIGGLPRGRIIEIYGPESSGKTTLALDVVAEPAPAAMSKKPTSRSGAKAKLDIVVDDDD